MDIAQHRKHLEAFEARLIVQRYRLELNKRRIAAMHRRLALALRSA